MNAIVLKDISKPLSNESLSTIPSLYADRAMDSLSSKYRFVPTSKVIDGMRDVGWVPVHVTQNRVVKPSKQGYQKHMIRFRSLESKVTVGDSHMEMVLINSHDGSSTYQLSAGMFRQVCMNGLVVGEETFSTIRFRHTGTVASEIIRASLDVIGFMPELNKSIDLMKNVKLDEQSVQRFTEHALRLRYPKDAPIRAESLNTARREADIGTDIWTTLNRIQENLINGGVKDGTRTFGGRLRTMRGVKGIDANLQLNKGVWSLAARLARGEELPDITVVTE